MPVAAEEASVGASTRRRGSLARLTMRDRDQRVGPEGQRGEDLEQKAYFSRLASGCLTGVPVWCSSATRPRSLLFPLLLGAAPAVATCLAVPAPRRAVRGRRRRRWAGSSKAVPPPLG